MTELPAWAAWLASVLVLIGAGFTLIGSLGLLKLGDFYKRVHAPTLGSTLGTALISLASVVAFSVHNGHLSLYAVLIFAFVTVTTPAGLMLLVRAAMFRDRSETQPSEGLK